MNLMKNYAIKTLLDKEPGFFETTRKYSAQCFADETYPLPAVNGNSVVWGMDVIKAAEENGVESIWCRETGDLPEEVLKTALTLENRKNSYSFAEKKRILEFLRENGIESCPAEIGALIQDEGDFTGLTEKYASLPEVLRKGIDRGLIDIKTALSVKDLDEAVFGILFDAEERISYSGRRIILRDFLEICRRDRLSPEQSRELMKEIAASENPGACIAAIRNPKMEAMKKSFGEYSEKYIKGSGIILEAPQNFEGSSYTVRFQLKSRNQLERIIKTLGKVKESAEELFKLL